MIMERSITARALGVLHKVLAEELQKNVASISAGNCNTGANVGVQNTPTRCKTCWYKSSKAEHEYCEAPAGI